MELLKFVRLSVVLVLTVSGKRFNPDAIRQLTINQIKHLAKDPRHGQVICSRLSKEPYFSVESVLGRAWRIYYTWNMDLENFCMDMIFRNATPSIIHRIRYAMTESLNSEPNWEQATMLVSLSRANHEMLLFADQGAEGSFQGVPNIINNEGIEQPTKTVSLLNFHLKLMYGGKYLLMADCQIGVISLSASRRAKPYRAEIASIADSLDFGPGLQACTADKNKNEVLPHQ